MLRAIRRRLGPLVLGLALVLPLLTPWSAAGAPAGAAWAEASPPGFISWLWASLVSARGEAGCILDPGGCADAKTVAGNGLKRP